MLGIVSPKVMKFPASELLGFVKGRDGKTYAEQFFGEREGLAVVIGPVLPGLPPSKDAPVVYREPASSPADARAKLTAWRIASGWPTD